MKSVFSKLSEKTRKILSLSSLRRFRCGFVDPFSEISKKFSFRIYGEMECILMGCFTKLFQKICFFTIRRKKWCFGTPVFQKSSFHCYGDLMALLGRYFRKKFCFSLYGDFKVVLDPLVCKKEPSRNLIHEGSLFGRHYNDNIFGFGTLRKLREQFYNSIYRCHIYTQGIREFLLT